MALGKVAMGVESYESGDRVVHGERPEWGVGKIIWAESAAVDGQTVRRYRVRFERAGVKTLTCPPALLAAATDEPTGLAPGGDGQGVGWIDRLEQKEPEEVMTRLPDGSTDPFKSVRGRLASALDLLRFTGSGSSLIDWAAMQSGLSDPLSRFNRHELEVFYRRFEQARDEHISSLVGELKRKDPEGLAQVVRESPPPVASLVKRLAQRK